MVLLRAVVAVIGGGGEQVAAVVLVEVGVSAGGKEFRLVVPRPLQDVNMSSSAICYSRGRERVVIVRLLAKQRPLVVLLLPHIIILLVLIIRLVVLLLLFLCITILGSSSLPDVSLPYPSTSSPLSTLHFS